MEKERKKERKNIVKVLLCTFKKKSFNEGEKKIFLVFAKAG